MKRNRSLTPAQAEEVRVKNFFDQILPGDDQVFE